jgi:AcrR family transcriptional regulator
MKRAKPLARGRPRQFDADKALDRAMHVFWKKGYEGTSLPDLTRAMRINRPSLYAAFGNKATLFRKAIDRYTAGPAGYVQDALKAPTARAVVRRLLNGAVDMTTKPRSPRGCLMVQGALACGDEAQPLRRTLNARRFAGEAALRKRLQRARSEGDLPRRTNPADLARYLVTVIHGLSVQAAGGASRRDLQGIARMAMKSVTPML